MSETTPMSDAEKVVAELDGDEATPQDTAHDLIERFRSGDCPFCGRDPYHYMDNGVGMERVAVVCCDLGIALFQERDEQLARVEGERHEAAHALSGLLDLIAHQAARLEEVQAETRRIQAAALVHIDEMTAFQRTMVIMERERDVAKAALTAAEAEKERYRAALGPFADAANGLAPDLPETDQVLLTVGGLPIAWVYTDQLRTARAALSEKEQGA